MRPKVVLGLIFLAVIFIGAMLLIKRTGNTNPPAAATATSATSEVVDA